MSIFSSTINKNQSQVHQTAAEADDPMTRRVQTQSRFLTSYFNPGIQIIARMQLAARLDETLATRIFIFCTLCIRCLRCFRLHQSIHARGIRKYIGRKEKGRRRNLCVP